MHLFKLLDAADLRLQSNDPIFNDKADLVLAILRSKGVLPYKRSTLNGNIHKQVSAALVSAHEHATTVDVTTRRAETLHEAGYSTKVLQYLDDAVRHKLLVSQTKKAEGNLALGTLLIDYLNHTQGQHITNGTNYVYIASGPRKQSVFYDYDDTRI